MKTKLLFLLPMFALLFAACEKDSKNEPNQKNGTENGHEWVDLGLPSGLKWATCNVGATNPEGYGDYFAWGETSPKTTYNLSTYKFIRSGSSSWASITKYTIPDGQKSGIWYNGDTFIGDNKTTLDLADDAAHVNWGGSWRMPTKAEQDELRDNCTWTETTKNGVNGYLIKSKKNNNSIFLPASGCRHNSSLSSVGYYGGYWSSSLRSGYSSGAYILVHGGGPVDWSGNYNRIYGQSVRPVCQ